MRLDTEAIAGLPCLEEALDCFRDAGLLSFVIDKEHWNENFCFNSMLPSTFADITEIQRHGFSSG